jgi:hypothetical protein
MIFGGLSEKEVEKITNALKNESIKFEVSEDASITDANEVSMKNNLRHLSPPSFSTHMLSVLISEDAFSNMSNGLKETLLTFGITNEVPEEFSELTSEPENIHLEITKGNKRVIGTNFIHTILFMLLIALITYYFKK